MLVGFYGARAPSCSAVQLRVEKTRNRKRYWSSSHPVFNKKKTGWSRKTRTDPANGPSCGTVVGLMWSPDRLCAGVSSCMLVLPSGSAVRRQQHSSVEPQVVHSTGECCPEFSPRTPGLQAKPSPPPWTWLWSGPGPEGHHDITMSNQLTSVHGSQDHCATLPYLHGYHTSRFEPVWSIRRFPIQRKELWVWMILEALTLRRHG